MEKICTSETEAQCEVVTERKCDTVQEEGCDKSRRKQGGRVDERQCARVPKQECRVCLMSKGLPGSSLTPECFRMSPASSAPPPTRGSVTLSTLRSAPRDTLVRSSAPNSPRSSAGKFIIV